MRSHFFTRAQRVIVLGIFLLAGVKSELCFAFISSWLKDYKVGIDYTSAHSYVHGIYESPAIDSKINDGSCTRLNPETDRMECGIGMNAGSESGFGIFLQRAFKRKSWFHTDADISINFRYLSGSLSNEDKAQSTVLPLKQLSFSLFAAVFRPYLQLGITPQSAWPDFLLSFGPTLQLAYGKVKVNDRSKNVFLSSTSGSNLISSITGFIEAELVLIRMKRGGAFSFFLSRDFSSSTEGNPFFPEDVDGMENFRANFYRSVGGPIAFGLGIKLLLNWP